jgi:oligoendopeptidase F
MAAENGFANWDLTSYFAAFAGPEYRAHRDGLAEALVRLEEDAKGLGRLSLEHLEAWAAVLLRHEMVVTDYSHLASYLGCLVAADTFNEAYKQEQAKMAVFAAAFKKALIPILDGLRKASAEDFTALTAREELRSARYHLERMREEARRSMEPELERLAADLAVDGISAWGRLYNDLAGRLEFEMCWPDGRVERVPMAQRTSLMNDSDPKVRKAVLTGSNRAWEGVAAIAAACLNGISGTRLTLNHYRGVTNVLEIAMFDAGVKEATIETMWKVVERNRDVPRNYLRRKAQIIGKRKLGFQDLTCPLPLKDQGRFSWQEGTGMVLNAFRGLYPSLGHFAETMLAQSRVESEKRPGKRPGAFCTTSLKTRESRVFMTFGGALGDIQTLAHELGHAFHAWVMREVRPFACEYPMTLAETASTFAEGILCNTVIEDDSTPELAKAQLLNSRLDHAALFLLDIHMRYLFEKALYAERAAGELTVSRLRTLMLEAQYQCFGDVLAEDEMDPLFWASKLHFYIIGVNFYNFPYTFGYLLSEGLQARAREDGPAFLPKYEHLLRLTGSYPAEEVVARATGIDLTREGFWQEAIDAIAQDTVRFEKIAGRVLDLAGRL